MIAKEKFEIIKKYIADSSVKQNSSYLVDKVREMNLEISGESSYMQLNCSFNAPDGSSIIFAFKSYDPSGPFQNLPDINKINLQLLHDGVIVEEINERYDDKSIYS